MHLSWAEGVPVLPDLAAVTAEMSDIAGVPGDWIVQGGAVGLLGIVVLMIVMGKLLPISAVRQLERDRDYWREVALRSMGQTDELLPGAKIASQVTAAFHEATTGAK